jgi:hypothetical protein
MSAEVLPLAVLAADVLLCAGVLAAAELSVAVPLGVVLAAAELLADVSLVEFAAPELEACGGFELGLVVLGEVELGLLLSVVLGEVLGFALELPIEPLVVPVPVAPAPLAAPMPLEEELPEVQWSEICRTSATWKVFPVLLVALELPALEVAVVEALAPPVDPVSCTCWPTYCCSLLVSPARV